MKIKFDTLMWLSLFVVLVRKISWCSCDELISGNMNKTRPA